MNVLFPTIINAETIATSAALNAGFFCCPFVVNLIAFRPMTLQTRASDWTLDIPLLKFNNDSTYLNSTVN